MQTSPRVRRRRRRGFLSSTSLRTRRKKWKPDVNGGLSRGSFREARVRNCMIFNRKGGAPGTTRTCGQLLRRQLLYPPELQARGASIASHPKNRIRTPGTPLVIILSNHER